MTLRPDDKISKELKSLYAKNKFAKILLDHMAVRGKGPKNGYTSLEQAFGVISEVDASVGYAEARDVLKGLADIGCGDFFLGRKNWPTRLVWRVNAINAGKAARGEVSDVSQPTDEEGVPAGMVEHPFLLRDGVTVVLQLPSDFSDKEAERLSRFVQALPK